ncbi:4-galactosyl-N-acetylglucosaminide 3-alpha-L-fucosyltransferase FUT6-like [Diadema setosum]|uniref:4-galactosyl-N-acetylglucosaminide 3-alpha-L-fucosyltransferase FUT6-like n=1 Tax=Diadema setosum TaxID=31175 RepID=UPI003B3B6AA9
MDSNTNNMSFTCRRAIRQVLNSRVSLRTGVLAVLGLIAFHLCVIMFLRTSVLERPNLRRTVDRKRELVVTLDKFAEVSPDRIPSQNEKEKANSNSNIDIKKIRSTSMDKQGRGIKSVHKSEAGEGTRNDTKESSEQESAEMKHNAVQGSRQDIEQNRCIRYLSAYTPRMAPFAYWREYVNLNEAFKEAKDVNSPYYSSRVTQHREFPTMFIKCPEHRCDVALRATADERFLARSDAVLINMAPQEVRYKMPRISERLITLLPRRVKVFFYAMECPLMMSYWDYTIKDIKYHYTMTYHSDSDVYFPYGRYIPGEPTDFEEINYAENKTSLLVWTASNCNNTFWPRYEWVQKLQELMPFDTYGKCGTKECLPPLSPNCTKQQSVYKFYLALENAPCDEYISEKFWVNSLANGVVPLVYGGTREAYERVAPPNSFVHVSDFASLQDLVDYLKMIDKNDNLYNEFFAWRRKGRVEKIYPDLYPEAFCRVLPKLSKYSKPPVKTIGESKYFRGCRGGPHRNLTKPGDISNWVPWR